MAERQLLFTLNYEQFNEMSRRIGLIYNMNLKR